MSFRRSDQGWVDDTMEGAGLLLLLNFTDQLGRPFPSWRVTPQEQSSTNTVKNALWSRAEQSGRAWNIQLNLTGQKWGDMNLASSFLVAGYPIFATVVCKLQTKVSAFKNEYVMQQSRCQ